MAIVITVGCVVPDTCWVRGTGHLDLRTPGRVLDELSEIHSMDVVLPTKSGLEIRTRCVSKPTDHQQILLDKLGLNLPTKINLKQM